MCTSLRVQKPSHSIPKAVPDSEQSYRKRSDLIVKSFVIITPAHPEVTPRNWSIYAPKDMEKCRSFRKLINYVFRTNFSPRVLLVFLRVSKDQIGLNLYIRLWKTIRLRDGFWFSIFLKNSQYHFPWKVVLRILQKNRKPKSVSKTNRFPQSDVKIQADLILGNPQKNQEDSGRKVRSENVIYELSE